MTPAEQRATELHCARVYLREARARRERSPAFSATLLQWAANARRRAAAIDLSPKPPKPPETPPLFQWAGL